MIIHNMLLFSGVNFTISGHKGIDIFGDCVADGCACTEVASARQRTLSFDNFYIHIESRKNTSVHRATSVTNLCTKSTSTYIVGQMCILTKKYLLFR